MDIIYIFDNNFVDIAIVSLKSLVANFDKKALLYIHLVCVNVTQLNKNKIREQVSDTRIIRFYDFDGAKLDVLPETVASKNTYVRLFMFEMIRPITEQILYLDCDILVREDLSSLKVDVLHGKLLGMVSDFIPLSYSKALKTGENYYNAGVILFNRKVFDNPEYQYRLFEFIKNNDISRFRYADQDIINILFESDIEELSLSYNAITPLYIFKKYENFLKAFKNCTLPKNFSSDYFSKIKSKCSIVHFAGNALIRPWYKKSKHPFSYEYNTYIPGYFTPKKYSLSFSDWVQKILCFLLPESIFSKVYNFLLMKYVGKFLINEK